MVTTEKRIRHKALKLLAASAALISFGTFAVTVAAPYAFATTFYVPGSDAPKAAKLAPLGNGPAIQLASAGEGFSEDCVRVTRVTGPGQKITPVRGFVCGK